MKSKLMGAAALLMSAQVFACTSALTLYDVPLKFYAQPLGSFTIRLSPTLSAIRNKTAAGGKPYYKKQWRGPCPGGLSGGIGQCVEYTVYPSAVNFTPDLMPYVKKYNHGRANRATVRILTNPSGTKYIYTTNHEKTFCGPYSVYFG